jgi:hypothetical protein
MSSFPILDLVIGLIFIYFLLSIICSSVVEMALTFFKIRAKNLETWLRTIFDKDVTQPDGAKVKLGQAIMDHCSVTALSDTGKSTSYIDAKNFVSALLEKITYSQSTIPKNIDDFITAIQGTTILSTEFQRVLLMYANEAKQSYQEVAIKTTSEIDLFRSKMENWYDTSMDRVGGKLKEKYSRPITFWVALITVILMNADSISLSKYLYNNPEARAKIAQQAYDVSKDSAFEKKVQQLPVAKEDSATITEIKQQWDNVNKANATLNSNIPLGWAKDEISNDVNGSWPLIFSKIAGLLATVFAVMMGAPFWFDLLNKVANLRGSGNKPASSTENKD